ncbi:MAG: MFS transporter [Chloroflexota bacterium]
MQKNESRFSYGYIIVICFFLTLFLMHGAHITFGVFFSPIQNELGWNKTVVSGAVSLGSILGGLFMIIAGRLTDRFGPRLIMTVSGVTLGLGFFLMSRVTSLWQLYLAWGVIIAIGISSGDVTSLGTTARWFVHRRGLMSGVVKVGTGLGILAMPLISGWLISSYGWRNAYIVLGVACLAIITSIAQLLKRDPGVKISRLHDATQEPAGSQGKETSGDTGFSLRVAVSTRQFWTVVVMFFLFNYCAGTLITHITPHGLSIGLSTTSAASLLSAIGGASIVGRLVMGGTSDRTGVRRGVVYCFLIFLIALVWLQFAKTLWPLYLFTAVYGFAHGGIVALISPLIAELFGTRVHGAIFGVVLFFGMLGNAIGVTIAGRIFDITSSYQMAFLIMALASFAGFVLSIILKPTRLTQGTGKNG